MAKALQTRPEREPLSFLEGEELLRPLFQAVDQHQRDIGMILWRMDPSPAELVKLAEEFGYAIETLRTWMRTATRIIRPRSRSHHGCRRWPSCWSALPARRGVSAGGGGR